MEFNWAERFEDAISSRDYGRYPSTSGEHIKEMF
jgi:hypothetical protein